MNLRSSNAGSNAVISLLLTAKHGVGLSMPDSPQATVTLRSQSNQEKKSSAGGFVSEVCDSPHAVVSALADSVSRTIIATTASDAKIVPELVEEHAISTATAYRKVETLTEVGLLGTRIRIRSGERNATEYVLRANSIDITITPTGNPEVTLSVRQANNGTETDHATNRTSNKTEFDADVMKQSLQNLFVDVTGTEEVINTQEERGRQRYLRDDAIPNGMNNDMTDDGLSDSLPKPSLVDEQFGSARR